MRKSKIELDENKDNKIKKNIKIDEKQLDAIEEELKDNKEIKEHHPENFSRRFHLFALIA